MIKAFKLTLLFLFLSTSLCFGGVDFDGNFDVITGTLDVDTVTTVACWVNMNKLSTVDFPILGWNESSSGQLSMGWSSAEKLFIAKSFVAFFRQSDVTADLNGAWHHIIFEIVENDAANSHIYLDGTEVTYSTTSNQTWTSDTTYRIGDDKTNEARGIINEIAVWSTVLTAQEITLLAKSRVKGMPLQIQPSNLIMYLPLDDLLDGGDLLDAPFADRSGSGADGIGGEIGGSGSGVGKAEELLSYPTYAMAPSLGVAVAAVRRFFLVN